MVFCLLIWVTALGIKIQIICSVGFSSDFTYNNTTIHRYYFEYKRFVKPLTYKPLRQREFIIYECIFLGKSTLAHQNKTKLKEPCI